MTNEQKDVRSWMHTFQQACPPTPTLATPEVRQLRSDLLQEELDEYACAISITDIADAIADCLVVILGTACAHGLDLEPIFQEVMKSNWSKFGRGPNNELVVLKNAQGKICKSTHFVAPSLEPIINFQTNNPL